MKNINIENKKAYFELQIEDKYTAGIQLVGSEIKSIRLGKCNIRDAFCAIESGELFVFNFLIDQYSFSHHYSHDPKRKKKLLLKKSELRKIEKKISQKGYTLVPLKLYIQKNKWAKLLLGFGKGKREYEKRETIKERDLKRDYNRMEKIKI